MFKAASIANDQEYDRVSLDMAKDFKQMELTAYALRSEILLPTSEMICRGEAQGNVLGC